MSELRLLAENLEGYRIDVSETSCGHCTRVWKRGEGG